MARSKLHETQKCDRCGAEIIMAVSETGRRMAIDADYDMRFVLESVDTNRVPYVTARQTYRSHWAVCPNRPQETSGRDRASGEA